MIADDTPLAVNRSYSFAYPTFTGEGYYRVRLRVNHIYEWNDSWMVKGDNIDSGKPQGYYYAHMVDVRPVVKETPARLAKSTLQVIAGLLALVGQITSGIGETSLPLAPNQAGRATQ